MASSLTPNPTGLKFPLPTRAVHNDLPTLPSNPGGLLVLTPSSQDAATYSKSKYESSVKIKLLLLKDHSYLDQYVIRFQKYLQNDTVLISRDVRIGMLDETPDQRDLFAFHDAATGH